jgi:hypothetical protein
MTGGRQALRLAASQGANRTGAGGAWSRQSNPSLRFVAQVSGWFEFM